MSSTTLITFLLRTPSNVRTVELLGSWDNFTRSYPMERDKRTGSGYWRGCHTFTDIIRDGSSPSQSPGRTGGLKMGGTYWYYYRLDGDIEYYNEVEPVTSLCPLLPGQPVNLLNVPVILPDTESLHRRDNSVSSIKSEHRTMDPKDKYMNPRTPPKPKPALPRLRTSPPLYQHSGSSWSFLHLQGNGEENRAVSQPASAAHSPLGHHAPKVKIARPVSPPLTKGLRAAFLNIARARSPSRDRGESRSRSRDRHDTGAELCDGPTLRVPVSNPSSNYSSRIASPMSSSVEVSSSGQLPFRRPLPDQQELCSASASIHIRRASRSSRENTPLASLDLGPSTADQMKNGNSSFSLLRQLDPLEETLSQQTTPVPMGTKGRSGALEPSTSLDSSSIREKRLPTLPNTPSSVMEEELRAINALNESVDMEFLQSHFSDYTSGVPSQFYTESPMDKSRFSEWSTDTELVSPASMTSCSTLNADSSQHFFADDHFAAKDSTSEAAAPSSGPPTPTLDAEPELLSPTKVASDSPLIGSGHTSPGANGFSNSNFEFSSLGIDDYDVANESDPKRYAGIFPTEVITSLSVNRAKSRDQPEPTRQFQSYMTESAAMKELMDEIGYLGDMISSGL
ncbi:hypothetical protein BGW36DRAFT_377184 [Talaromyces proteolyticus]|uniref:Uncharacterized protein n=1 Tax=Talaromyces proteolyticus TaxID=1131652 RepID=A0AAD4Q200_9EURO|nr:uncharacterized protein BGW36DRAFT_377184 [Talaromyces proteolyticus]KAH8699045.1 hypothetical protein BGW36DRAFT_377184 [Talaromyces proteolyticus]